MMKGLAFQLPRQMSLALPLERGSGIVKEMCIKENAWNRIGLIVLKEKCVNSKKKKMSREIVNSEGTVQNEKRRRAT
jgi:hypothetical protein